MSLGGATTPRGATLPGPSPPTGGTASSTVHTRLDPHRAADRHPGGRGRGRAAAGRPRGRRAPAPRRGRRRRLTGDGETQSFPLHGRSGVFAGPTDVAYAPPGRTLRIAAPPDLSERGRRARRGVPARTEGGVGIPARYLAAAEVPVELRGAGIASRQVRNFGVPGVLDAAPDHRLRGRSPRPATGARGRRTSTTPTAPGPRPSSRRSTGSRPLDQRPRRRPVGYQRVYGTSTSGRSTCRRGAHR